MRILRVLLIFILLICSFSVVTLAEEPISLVIDGNKINCEVPPTIVEGRTMVPLGAVSGTRNCEVEWNEGDKSVFIRYKYKEVSFKMGQTSALVNGVTVKMDIAPMVIQEKTMLPARFAADIFDYKIEWNDAKRTVKLTDCASDTAPVSLVIDGEEVACEVQPVVIGDKTIVPLGAISSARKAETTWNASERTLEVKYADKVVHITIGEKMLL